VIETNNAYHLVHIISSGEHKTPLIASQVFDRAQAQAAGAGAGKPASISVWIMVPMREVVQEATKTLVASFIKRCPDVKITLVGGISRLGNWPAFSTMRGLRRALKGRAIYHCRGESSLEWISPLKERYPDDAVVLDVRGYWPIERFLEDNVFNVKDMSPAQLEVYAKDEERLRKAISKADWVCTVSEPLRQILIDKAGARGDTPVLPCSVKNVVPDNQRSQIRKSLDIDDKIAVLYLGGTQKGQNLEELSLPFIKSAIAASRDNVGVFITQHKAKMAELISKFGIDKDRIRLISVPQNEVAAYLSAMDMGLLLKAPSDLNNTSQPVKFGEYLSAGIPVILEKGTGNLSEMLDRYKIGFVVSLTDKKDQQEFDAEVQKALDWFLQNKNEVRSKTRAFVDECYTWTANLPRERKMYEQVLERVSKNKHH
jgi:glycosyltransferase involved in cell wall biosynthesis